MRWGGRVSVAACLVACNGREPPPARPPAPPPPRETTIARADTGRLEAVPVVQYSYQRCAPLVNCHVDTIYWARRVLRRDTTYVPLKAPL